MQTRKRYNTKKNWRNVLSGGVLATVVVFAASCASSRISSEGETFRDDNVKMQSAYHFKDLHGEQLYAAQKYGVTPIDTREKLEDNHRRLKKIESNEYYLIDPLTHSAPYLTNGAKSVLKEIAEKFQEELERAGYRQHRIIVTSMFRTREDVKALRETNSAASKNSAHMYGTTFDISFTRFNRTSMNGEAVSNEVMCNILGKIVYDLRQKGECWAIFEPNQHCIHVTARKI